MCICILHTGTLSSPDTNGAEESVVVSEVSSFQRLKCMQEQYLGLEKVSCLERCPQFRSLPHHHVQCRVSFWLTHNPHRIRTAHTHMCLTDPTASELSTASRLHLCLSLSR